MESENCLGNKQVKDVRHLLVKEPPLIAPDVSIKQLLNKII